MNLWAEQTRESSLQINRAQTTTTDYSAQVAARQITPIPKMVKKDEPGPVGVTSAKPFYKSKIFIIAMIVLGVILGLGLIVGIILIALYGTSNYVYLNLLSLLEFKP